MASPLARHISPGEAGSVLRVLPEQLREFLISSNAGTDKW